MSLKISLFLRKKTVSLTTAEKLVLHTIADRVGLNDCAWISQVELIDECELSEPGFQTIQRRLVEKKLIKVKKRAGSRGKKNSYFLSEYLLQQIGITTNTYLQECEKEVIPISRNSNTYLQKLDNNQPDHIQPIEKKEEKSEISEIDYRINKTINNTKTNNTLSSADAPSEGESETTHSPLLALDKNQPNSVSGNRSYQVENDQKYGFNEFKEHYPIKVGMDQAEKVWIERKLHFKAETILRKLKNQVLHDIRWRQKGGRYIPDPDNYLARDGWERPITTEEENNESIPASGTRKLSANEQRQQEWAKRFKSGKYDA